MKEIKELIDVTLAWGSDIADMWTGTQFEKQIDLQQAQIIKAVEKEDWKRAENLTTDLAQFLFYAEEEYARG